MRLYTRYYTYMYCILYVYILDTICTHMYYFFSNESHREGSVWSLTPSLSSHAPSPPYRCYYPGLAKKCEKRREGVERKAYLSICECRSEADIFWVLPLEHHKESICWKRAAKIKGKKSGDACLEWSVSRVSKC